jgi:hypothetical protein
MVTKKRLKIDWIIDLCLLLRIDGETKERVIAQLEYLKKPTIELIYAKVQERLNATRDEGRTRETHNLAQAARREYFLR